jgi:hypothetical protein
MSLVRAARVSDSLDHQTSVDVGGNGHLRIADDRGVGVTAGCSSVNANTVDCGLPSAVTHISAALGAGNDEFYGADVLTVPTAATAMTPSARGTRPRTSPRSGAAPARTRSTSTTGSTSSPPTASCTRRTS